MVSWKPRWMPWITPGFWEMSHTTLPQVRVRVKVGLRGEEGGWFPETCELTLVKICLVVKLKLKLTAKLHVLHLNSYMHRKKGYTLSF